MRRCTHVCTDTARGEGADRSGMRREELVLTLAWCSLRRYPRVMAEEGLRVVRQWLEASSQLEEGERESAEGCAWGPGRPAC